MIKVSVIVPCFNEQETILQLLEAVLNQSYPLDETEVIIADGLSTDHTRDMIKAFQVNHPNFTIRIIDNKKRIIPSGLNRAIEDAQGEYIVRMDAHSIPDRDYIKYCINGLKKGLGDNIGGIWKIQPGAKTWIAKAIAIAASHPLGVGDALYRIGGIAQEVDTVPFGAFRRELIDKIGMFDETLLTNEDYEFNTRVRQSGGKVWMDPSIRSVYFARASLKELAHQYWRYGYWKAQMLRKYPKTLRWRQGLPPLFVFALISLGLLSLICYFASWVLVIIVLLYTTVISILGIKMSINHKDISMTIGVPLAIATIHLSYGSALLWGLVIKPKASEIHK
jgi:cellulose synthase/poly-beta-1,6-N-acetylglucosamine synthase-like glycosyltransferase